MKNPFPHLTLMLALSASTALTVIARADLSAPLPEIIIEEDGKTTTYQEEKKVEKKTEKVENPSGKPSEGLDDLGDIGFEIIEPEDTKNPKDAKPTKPAPKKELPKKSDGKSPAKEKEEDNGLSFEIVEPEIPAINGLPTPTPKPTPAPPSVPVQDPIVKTKDGALDLAPLITNNTPAPEIVVTPTPMPTPDIVVVEPTPIPVKPEPGQMKPMKPMKPIAIQPAPVEKDSSLTDLFIIEEPAPTLKPTPAVPAPVKPIQPTLVENPLAPLPGPAPLGVPELIETPEIQPIPNQNQRPDLADLAKEQDAVELSQQDVENLIFHLQQEARRKEAQKASLVPNLPQEEITFVDSEERPVFISAVLQLLADQAGFNFIAPEMPEERISLRLKNMTPLEAFHHVAKSRGYVVLTKHGVTTLTRADIKIPEFLIVKKYNLQHMNPKWMMQQIANFLELEMNEPAESLATYPAPREGNIGGSGSGGGSGGGSQQSSQSSQGGQGGGQGGQNVGLPTQSRWTSSLPFDEPAYKGKTAEGGAEAKYAFIDRTSRAIVVRATDADHKMLSQYIMGADKPEPQIIIEAKIVEVSINDALSLGTDWSNVLDGGFTIDGAAKAFDWQDVILGSELTVQPGAAQLAFNAFQRMGNTMVSNMPKTITRSSVPVTIASTITESIEPLNGSGTIDGGTTINTGAALNTFTTGLSLDVVPQLMANGIIDLNISTSIASKVADSNGLVPGNAGANRNPTISNRALTTSASVRSGMTLVIGGLTVVDEDEKNNGVPFLSKIPVIGKTVFGRTEKVKTSKTMILFVTPTVIYPDEYPSVYTNHQEWAAMNMGQDADFKIDKKPMPQAREIRKAIPIGNTMGAGRGYSGK